MNYAVDDPGNRAISQRKIFAEALVAKGDAPIKPRVERGTSGTLGTIEPNSLAEGEQHRRVLSAPSGLSIYPN